MSYTPPPKSAVNFNTARTTPYTPPPRSAVNFNGREDGGTIVDAVGDLVCAFVFSASAAGEYDNAVARYRQREGTSSWQVGARGERAAAMAHRTAGRADGERAAPWTSGERRNLVVSVNWRSSRKGVASNDLPWRMGAPRGATRTYRWAATRPIGAAHALPWTEGAPRGGSLTAVYQAMAKRRSDAAIPWGAATTISRDVSAAVGAARRAPIDVAIPWDRARAAPPGVRPIIIDPGAGKCYIPPWGDDVNLIFDDEMFDPSTDLIFVCANGDVISPETVVVPVRRVYMQFNEFALFRYPDMTPIPTTSLSMSLDVDSFSWSFQASVAGVALPLVEAVDGEPVTLRAVINGVPFHWLAQTLSRDRSFNSSAIRVAGNSVLSTLASPLSPNVAYFQEEALTISQLIDQVLSYNGVTLGVPVEFDLDDWLVPARTFSHSGSYIDGVMALAAAGGGYVQPHDTGLALRVRHRYPYLPRDWATAVTPDFVLPSAVTTRESIEWTSRPLYNRVHLDGASLAEITASGTAGDLPVPGVIVEPLLSEPAGWLQRGRAELGNTGRQAMVGLSLPVLTATGIIRPGQWVSYVDGLETRLGLVRSVSVQVAMPRITQTLSVETHIL